MSADVTCEFCGEHKLCAQPETVADGGFVSICRECVYKVMLMFDQEPCPECGGSGKRTDPVDGTVWPDDPCTTCGKKEES